MKNSKNITDAFLSILRAGLWEQDVRLSQYGGIDISAIYNLSEEQSVIGLVTAGIEKVQDIKVPQQELLQFIGTTLQIEKRNKDVNDFVAKLINRLVEADVFALVVKGQGVAQSYEKPLWRSSGDVDLLLDEENYEKAKKVLFPIAYDIQEENLKKKHLALKLMGVDVELHGRMPFALNKKTDYEIDKVIFDSLHNGAISVWRHGNEDIIIPNTDNHVLIVFTHFLHHFFIEGVGLRQICDWCRLLWFSRNTINEQILFERIDRMGLMMEWQVFGSLAVDYLGMQKEAMPFYNSRYRAKGKKVLNRILKSGNFGHNNDLSYKVKYKGVSYKFVSLLRRLRDFMGLTLIFPKDAPKFFLTYIFEKVK